MILKLAGRSQRWPWVQGSCSWHRSTQVNTCRWPGYDPAKGILNVAAHEELWSCRSQAFISTAWSDVSPATARHSCARHEAQPSPAHLPFFPLCRPTGLVTSQARAEHSEGFVPGRPPFQHCSSCITSLACASLWKLVLLPCLPVAAPCGGLIQNAWRPQENCATE